MAGTPTANMGLVAPASGDSDYPTTISTTFTTVDLHDHTTGKGLPIPTGGISNGAITKAKLAALGQQTSATVSQLYLPLANGSETAVAGLSITITTTGRPVFIGLISDPATFSYILISAATPAIGLIITLYRDATLVAKQHIQQSVAAGGLSLELPTTVMSHFDVPAAGTYTYSIKVEAIYPNNNVEIRSVKMFGYEL